ncbi:MAG: hypothetical protein FWD06_00880 [Oscillospiraceae bacterium]|nr:hypothetical protein [Oscillospiraceae bacterium]
MKRIAQLTLALLLALALMLPVAAIANLDGSDPEWDGYASIRPASDILIIGDIEPDAEPDYDIDADEPNRAQFARTPYDDVNSVDVPELGGSGIMAISGELEEGYIGIEPIDGYLDIEPISANVGHSIPVALFYVALGVAVLALLLAVVALVKKK